MLCPQRLRIDCPREPDRSTDIAVAGAEAAASFATGSTRNAETHAHENPGSQELIEKENGSPILAVRKSKQAKCVLKMQEAH